MSVQQLFAPIAADMQAVDTVIRNRLHSDVALIRRIAEYIVGSGGKRLRPALVLYAAGALGYRGVHHHELAAVVEFIHTASLLHDDVVDESDLRRGKRTANAAFGNASAVLVGDFLYSRAFQMMVGVNEMRVMRVLADATNIIAEGEVLQLLNCHNADVVIDDYLRVIRYKTAKLFEAAARLGAVLAGRPQEEELALGRYGLHLGTAFQLIDDALDYSASSAELGKNIGDDLAEGKPTLPLIHAMRYGSPKERKIIREVIEQGGLERIESIMQAIESTGALNYTLSLAAKEAEQASAHLDLLPGSPAKDALIELARFAVKRRY